MITDNKKITIKMFIYIIIYVYLLLSMTLVSMSQNQLVQYVWVSGSSEAQEALQKFTGFLEAEAENGRISRSLEKKVLGEFCLALFRPF